MQIIIVMETRPSCGSDYKYIKSALDYFYVPRTAQLHSIYATSKSELIKQESKIRSYCQKYPGESKVVVVADYDNPSDCSNSRIKHYCEEQGYDLVWMNLDIEDVFLGGQIPSRNKGKATDEFLKRVEKRMPSAATFEHRDPQSHRHASNLLVVFDKYLIRK